MRVRRGGTRGSHSGAKARWLAEAVSVLLFLAGAVAPRNPSRSSAEPGPAGHVAAYARDGAVAAAGINAWRSEDRAVGYRPEVDGLRAVAILPVVLFHAGVLGFEGGYVGVDVFFVISGYLITCLIQRELDRGDFSFIRFWERRARRILPALTVVVVFSLAAGWFILIPSDLERLGASALAQALFASNILFWRESGYFNPDADTKPLLHTWSLSVEEQFYLCFPLVLFLLARVGWLVRARIIAGALLLSLLLSIYSVTTQPAATFYLLPTRAWELLLGSLLAVSPGLLRLNSHAVPWNGILSWLGLAAIAAAVFCFTADTPFPGLAALLPCLGTAAIIRSNEQSLTSLGRVLSSAPLVQLGLISYSLYLWHWPLIVFASYASFDALTPLELAAIIVSSVALAWLSWRFVENPVRRRVFLRTRPRLAVVAASGLLLTGAIGLSAAVSGGFPSRLPPDAQRYAEGASDFAFRSDECHISSLELTGRVELCQLGTGASGENPALLVWGDSHASALLPILNAMSAEYSIPAAYASYSGCPPLQGVFSPGMQNYGCPDFNRTVLKFAIEHEVRHVLLIGNWTLYTEGEEDGDVRWLIIDDQSESERPEDARAVFKRRFTESVALLLEHGFTVWIVRQVPLQSFPPPRRLTQVALYGGDPTVLGRPVSEHIERQAFVNSVFNSVRGPRVHLIDPTPLLCREKGLCEVARDGRSLYRDEHHLSRFGALQTRPLFEGMFESLAHGR